METKKKSGHPGREICPPGFAHRWKEFERQPAPEVAGDLPQNDLERIRSEVPEWIKAIQENLAAFREHVYENANATQDDFRQHRRILTQLIAYGEGVAFELSRMAELGPDDEELLVIIDTQTMLLLQVLFEWHGPADEDPKIPDSLKQSMRELVAGKSEPFDL
jgi:hypothetical protein